VKTKKHYDNHLGHFYSWMIGDFEIKKNEFKAFCVDHNILPTSNKICVDLGAGNGLQTIALAEVGFVVTAVDFNDQLLTELRSKNGNYPIKIVMDDIRAIGKLIDDKFELVVSCGDTLTHLDTFDEAEKLIHEAYERLLIGGKVVLSFRDYGNELEDTNRFIHVKGATTGF
jgi:SAM-dependent methyltransferase